MSLDTKTVTVTPAMAQEWLSKQIRNRKWRRDVVNRYKTEMLAGRWKENGQPIVFEGNNYLVDGQHRLRAIIEANIPVKLLVVYGVKTDAAMTIDTGLSRTLGDVFMMRGVRNAKLLSRTSKLLLVWETGIKELKEKRMFTKELMNVHPEQIYEYYVKHQLDVDRVCAEFKNHTPLVRSIGGAVLSFVSLVLEKIDSDKSYIFMGSFVSGNIKKEWSYMAQLRDQLISRNPKSKLRVTENERISFLFGLWNVIFHGASVEEVESSTLNIPSELLKP